jgi:hypothetical protein
MAGSQELVQVQELFQVEELVLVLELVQVQRSTRSLQELVLAASLRTGTMPDARCRRRAPRQSRAEEARGAGQVGREFLFAPPAWGAQEAEGPHPPRGSGRRGKVIELQPAREDGGGQRPGRIFISDCKDHVGEKVKCQGIFCKICILLATRQVFRAGGSTVVFVFSQECI